MKISHLYLLPTLGVTTYGKLMNFLKISKKLYIYSEDLIIIYINTLVIEI